MATFFPHLISTGNAPTSRVISDTYRQAFAQQVSDGIIRPLVIPYNFWGIIALIIYLCIPHRDYPIVYAARWPLLAALMWFQWTTLWRTSSISYATGYMSGLINAWIMVWGWTWLVFMRPQWDAKRVERIVVRDAGRSSEITHKNPLVDGNLRRRKLVDESKKMPSQGTSSEAEICENTIYRYFWQSYPNNLKQRFLWVFDLIVNFRGPGWNWVISPLPSLPPHILAELGEPVSVESHSKVSSAGFKRFDTRRELLMSRGPKLLFGYFLLDALKVFMMKDPYYKFGPTTYALPWHLQSFSPLALHIYRQLLSSGTIIAWLTMFFYLSPLIFSILCGPRIFGLRAEAWYYSSAWGSFSTVYYKGLGALWGNYWHQTFRQCFIAPSNYIIQKGYCRARSAAAIVCSLLCAFGISGFLHWAGGVSIFGPTYPSQHIVFFALQALGILIQSTFCTVLKPYIRILPQKVRCAGNLTFTLIWMFSTGWILADDFARGGFWLWEPVPLSPLRGMGFGEPDAGWWCWEHIGIRWYTGKHWWDSGISI